MSKHGASSEVTDSLFDQFSVILIKNVLRTFTQNFFLQVSLISEVTTKVNLVFIYFINIVFTKF